MEIRTPCLRSEVGLSGGRLFSSLSGMKRPSVHHFLRVAFIAFGISWLVFACFRLEHWVGYRRTESVVEAVHPAFKDHGQIRYNTNAVLMRGTKPALSLRFM